MAEPERQIGFEQVGIASILARHALRVPLNQREYSWTKREVADLFHDLAGTISSNAPEYFLGSIVAIPTKPGVLEVVDGQQRLATTAILLAAIRNYLRGRDGDKLIVEYIETTFLTAIDPDARQRLPRIRLNVVDGTYFDLRILREDRAAPVSASSHRRIDEAAALAAQQVLNIVGPHDAKNHGDVLNTWIRFLEHRAIVILLKVPSDVNAYKMFETLNDRGLRTSQSDLVKNYLFGEAGDRLPEAQQKWSSMKALLESLDDDDITITFLRQMLISLYGHLREPKVYEKVREKARGVDSALRFLTQLESGAVDYVAMLNPEHQRWNQYPATSRRAIQTLVLLRMKPIRPVILSVIRSFSPQETDKALRLLVNVSVRLLIVGGARSGSVEEAFATAAKATSDDKVTMAQGLLQTLEGSAPTDAEFEEAFKVATVSQAYLARYYLRSLEAAARNEPHPCFIPNDDQQIINLEHILPEKPERNWPQFSSDQVDAFYKRLGNMALMPAKQNSDLKSAPFVEKRKVLAGTGYRLTSDLTTEVDWTTESIMRRQKAMAGLAVKTWPLAVP